MKTILVLEDEPLLLNLMRSVLARRGYKVLLAARPEEAVRQFVDYHRQIDLLIADVVLPGGSGLQVALLLRSELAELSVILTSGYPRNSWNTRDSSDLLRLGPDSLSILLKPFTPKILLQTIGKWIGAPSPAALGASAR